MDFEELAFWLAAVADYNRALEEATEEGRER
jgi:hypothetical protein